MENYNYRPEKQLVNAPESIPSTNLENILGQMKESICKIKCKDGGNATGFFCIIPHPTKFNQLPVLMTNYHVINEEYKKIIFTLNNDKFTYEIILNNTRKIYYSHDYDISIIEIKESDKLQKISYLELDDNIFKDNPNDIYMNTSIYLIGYPKGGISKYSMGIFKLLEEDDFTIRHLCQSDPGSSGCPIIKLNNNRVIGIHKGAHSKSNFNLGTFIKKPIEEFNKTKLSGGGEGKAKEGLKPEDNSSSVKALNNSLQKKYISKKDEPSNPQSNQEDNNIEVDDNLNFENNSNIKNKIGDEKIYFSDKIIKINSRLFFKNQEINLLITNLAIYHIVGNNEIQRRIQIYNLKAITISKISNQFILHFNVNEYDVLYKYDDRKK